MSARFVAVQWNARKVSYDLVLLAGVALFINLFQFVGARAFDEAVTPNSQILAMRAWGLCAFWMLTGILVIGPLARLSPTFAPLLYNRRHYGVIFCGVAIWHAKQVLDFYHAYGEVSPLESLFTFDASFAGGAIPFQLFGAAALLFFMVMAATSHDFWQHFFGARFWKSMHMGVYLAYAAVVLHVALGALQQDRGGLWTWGVGISLLLVSGLHVATALREGRRDASPAALKDGWIDAGPSEDLVLDEAKMVLGPEGEAIALCRHDRGISAVHGVCAHQGGPLAEGRVIDGCLTCPWHGWQYRPEDGRAPEPFEEKIPTHRVKIDGDGRVWVEAKSQPAGTPIPPEKGRNS